MRRNTVVLAVVLGVAVSLPVMSSRLSRAEPATRPSSGGGAVTPGLEKRAMESLAAGDYAAALPLLRRMADFYKDDARKLKAVQEQITLCEKQLNSGNGPESLTPEHRKPIPLPKEGEVVSFENIKDLGNFEYDAEKGGGIPADVKALSGKVIKLRGFMIPMDQAESISNFALVPSLFSCCFGQPPQIQHTVVVRTPKGKAVSYYPDEIVIEGKLSVEEKREDGYIVSVFEVVASSVKPAGK